MRDWAEELLVVAGHSDADLLHSVSGVHDHRQFPLAVYEGYFREHKYGLATQTFGPWMGDQLVGLAVGVVLGGIASWSSVRDGAAPGEELVGVGGGRQRRLLRIHLS